MFDQPENNEPLDANDNHIGFFDALVGLLVKPPDTARQLFSAENPPYSLSMLTCVIASIYIPAFSQIHRYGYDLFSPGVLVRLTLVFALTFAMFTLLEKAFLTFFRFTMSWRNIVDSCLYSISPCMVSLWIMCCINYFIDGRLTLITVLLEGYGAVDPVSTLALPYAIVITGIYVFVIFSSSIAAASGANVGSGAIVATISLIPLALALSFSLVLTEFLWAGSLSALHELYLTVAEVFPHVFD